jgi:desulfoferrodoxin-like iron-binding protein
MPSQIGKIYLCAGCGAQIIVTKGGSGTLRCCGTEMQQKK